MQEIGGFPWLETLSAAALAISLWIYILLDGTDLGVGMLCAFQRSPEARHIINLSLLPVWDGNETWLVLTVGALLGLFPLAYGIVLSALYVPVFMMLLALVVRGMAIEYRHYAPRLFDTLLVVGSLLAALTQGIIFGALFQGIPTDGQHYTGNGIEWLLPFPLYCGMTLASGYCVMGAGWLIWRCTNELEAWGRHMIPWLAGFAGGMLGGLLVWCSLLPIGGGEHLRHPWLWLPLAIVALLAVAMLTCSLLRRWVFVPLASLLVIASCAFITLIIAVFPWIVPPMLTLHQAAAPASTQRFLLLAFAILTPITLLYNTWAFRIFSGKISG